MYFNDKENRVPLKENTILSLKPESDQAANPFRVVVDRWLASGGFAMMHLSHIEGNDGHYYALKEMFPRQIEDAAVERRASDGRIILYNPLIERAEEVSVEENEARMGEVLPFFTREVEMAKKAGLLYFDGEIRQQNSADVLSVRGPYISEEGNRYLLIDTYDGYSLQDYIDSGWESEADRGVVPNSRLKDLIDLLSELTDTLTDLHANKRVYHLDISPANIYLVHRSGGTALHPYIIDWGSSYDRDSEDEKTGHRFTKNPFSPPEIHALAELQDQGSGYFVDETTDTYSLVNIVFYAVTGKVFAPSMIFDPAWRKQISRLYPVDRYGALGKELVDFFAKGLAADQRRRYATVRATPLGNAQSKLSTALNRLFELLGKNPGRILSAVEDDELQSYRLLDQYPLYKYAVNQEIHVLLLGSGDFNQRMLRAVLHVGQMGEGWSLHIHVVSASAQTHKSLLLNEMPELAHYAELDGDFSEGISSRPYAHITFEQVRDLNDPETCRQIAEKYAQARYVVVSLGSNITNREVATRYAELIAAGRNNPAVVHYYTEEETVADARGKRGQKPQNGVEFIPFGISEPVFRKYIDKLGAQAFRLHDVYARGLSDLYRRLLRNRESRKKTFVHFTAPDNEYDQRSSAAAAFHTPYVLKSLGIPVTGDRLKTVRQYTEKLEDPETYSLLVEMEHRRWMMFMISDGFRCPEPSEIRRFAFRYNAKGEFIGKFVDRDAKLHPCLVPCDANGLKLSSWNGSQSEAWTHAQWNAFSSDAEIDACDSLDPLEKMSLRLHRYAGERSRQSSTREQIRALFDGLCDYIGDVTNEEETPETVRSLLKTAEQRFDRFLKRAETALNDLTKHEVSDCLAVLDELRDACKAIQVNLDSYYDSFSNAFKLFGEYVSYRDYKKSDVDIIENRMYVYYGSVCERLVKFMAPSPLENVIVPITLEPETVLFFGNLTKETGADGETIDDEKLLREFFDARESDIHTDFHPCPKSIRTEDIIEELKRITSEPGEYVFDITGTTKKYEDAAKALAGEDKRFSVIRYDDESRTILTEAGVNSTSAPFCRINGNVSARELFGLLGAKEKVESSDNSYMTEIEHLEEKLWPIFIRHRENWEGISGFFCIFGRPEKNNDFHIPALVIPANCVWKRFHSSLDGAVLKRSNLPELLKRMEDIGFIRDVTMIETEAHIKIEFDCPDVSIPNMNGTSSTTLVNKFNNLFDRAGMIPFSGDISCSGETFTIYIRSGTNVVYNKSDAFEFSSDKKNPPKTFSMTEHVWPFLKDLAEAGLIVPDYSFKCGKSSIDIRFEYVNPSLHTCLEKAGNILELHIFHVLRKSGLFDDVLANFSFWWSDRETSNELDVLATRGTKTLAISCKTGKMNKEHLYEIAYLAAAYQSIPVIVYSSSKAVDDDGKLTDDLGPVKRRAKSMGVALFDLEDLAKPDFERRIAKLLV